MSKCTWTYGYDCIFYDTECDEMHIINNELDKGDAHYFKYCPYCGKEIDKSELK